MNDPWDLFITTVGARARMSCDGMRFAPIASLPNQRNHNHPDDLMNRRQVILVTGASVGLGLAIGRRLIDEQTKSKLHVVLTSRKGSLQRFAEQGIVEQEGVWIRALDVTDPEQRQAVVAEIASELGGVDILINNAVV